MNQTQVEVVVIRNGERVIIPILTTKDLPSDVKETRSRRCQPYQTPERQELKTLLTTKFIKNSSLPLWVAEIARGFDPADPTFYESKLRPELERRRIARGENSLSCFQPQVDSLKRFLLLNYPDLVSDEVKRWMEEVKPDGLRQKGFLEAVKLRISQPNQLAKLHRAVNQMSRKVHQKNGISESFARLQIFKDSYNDIRLGQLPSIKSQDRCGGLDDPVELLSGKNEIVSLSPKAPKAPEAQPITAC